MSAGGCGVGLLFPRTRMMSGFVSSWARKSVGSHFGFGLVERSTLKSIEGWCLAVSREKHGRSV